MPLTVSEKLGPQIKTWDRAFAQHKAAQQKKRKKPQAVPAAPTASTENTARLINIAQTSLPSTVPSPPASSAPAPATAVARTIAPTTSAPTTTTSTSTTSAPAARVNPGPGAPRPLALPDRKSQNDTSRPSGYSGMAASKRRAPSGTPSGPRAPAVKLQPQSTRVSPWAPKRPPTVAKGGIASLYSAPAPTARAAPTQQGSASSSQQQGSKKKDKKTMSVRFHSDDKLTSFRFIKHKDDIEWHPWYLEQDTVSLDRCMFAITRLTGIRLGRAPWADRTTKLKMETKRRI